MHEIEEYMNHLVFFIFTLVFSFLINRLFLKFSGTLGTKNSKDVGTVIRWGSTSKPAFGGVSFYIIFLASFALYASLFAEEVIEESFVGVLVAATIGFLIGLADDAYNTRPLLKFLGQVLCGVVLVYTNNHIAVFETSWINYTLTVLWVVGLMNSINMLDNMDAITTVVSMGVIIGAILTLVIAEAYNHFYFWLLLGVLASLLGFLYFNWNPSKMYMGDTGSQFLGVLLAAIGIYFFWNGHHGGDRLIEAKVVVPFLIFLPSIVDTAVVVINRISKKQSPFVGGKDHTTHHLSYLGLSDRAIAVVFLLLSLLSVGIGLFVGDFVHEWTTLTVVLSLLYCLAVFAVLFAITKIKKKQVK